MNKLYEDQNLHQLKSPLSDPNLLSKSTPKCEHLLDKNQFLKSLCSEVWKGGFQLIQILGLLGLGMYFDAVVAEVKTF